ncbi:N-acetyl-beta-glucosaminidase [Histoplasma capsulatum G186AR]|uniref:Beta-hexosaminidase n=2 Tax=Ajellomyces capsulatus TaxID=5037 RepID=C0NSG3_AJECG|nr:N-acetyl-beta-glucosaminidase [Histoplasma capsulatum G186AR]EEH05829.1 N-acetyl-beta-glucosaminidase [Histoplasma capsulatum G186AR]KAG5300004.1 N-acetyl-beta-glucosaminidase [Histoplasma capsulatum]QSS67367.1 N-acetyl-beta-glucosaminidase [Histoplasma capsulatum G186AR]
MLTSIVTLLTFVSFSLAVWPQLQEFKFGNTTVWLASSAEFSYQPSDADNATEARDYFSTYVDLAVLDFFQTPWLRKDKTPEKRIPSVAKIVQKAIKRTGKEIYRTKFVPWKFHPRNSSYEPALNRPDAVIRQVIIKQMSANQSQREVRDYIHEDESYTIEILATGEATISTNSAIGTIRALQTFKQLFYAHSSGSGVYTPYAPISISDAPKWGHRGLNLDISRNAYTPEDIKRTIDAMASAKMNRLHIHATDSQSWPLDIPSMPELAAKGAYHPSLILTSSKLSDIQMYGLERGVSVFLEIDMPGHTGSIGYAFPELVSAFLADEWEKYALQPPSGQIKLNSSDVDKFLDELMADLLPRVSPFTRYFHTGGDEFNLNTYLLEEAIGSSKEEVLRPLLQAVVTRLHTAIRKAGLTPIVWEELVADWDLSLSPSPTEKTEIIVQAWRNSTAVKYLLDRGYRTIFGSGDAWYLDCGQGTYVNPKRSSTAIKEPFLDWCSPKKNWKHMYMYNPLEGISEDLHHLLEGGETHMWSENVDPVALDMMVWPRAAAAAEVLWSGPRTANQIQDASYRLSEWRERAVVDLGVGASLAQMTYCLMREGSCEL